jgi:hypothetical protein
MKLKTPIATPPKKRLYYPGDNPWIIVGLILGVIVLGIVVYKFVIKDKDEE